MKALFWILVLLNLGYWMWNRWEQPPTVTTPPPIHAQELAPLASVAPRLAPSQVAQPAPLAPSSPAAATPLAPSTLTPSVPSAAAPPAPVKPESTAAPPPASQAACLLLQAGNEAERQRLKDGLTHLGISYEVLPHVLYRVVSPAMAPAEYARLKQRLAALAVSHVPLPGSAKERRVSYGLFEERANAVREQQRLRKAGLQAVLDAAQGPATRYLTGPLPEGARRRVRALGLKSADHACAAPTQTSRATAAGRHP